MGDQRHPGLPGGARPGLDELPFVGRDVVRPGGDLDRPGADAGLADTLGDLLYIDGSDVLDREVPEGMRNAFRLEVRAGRADDVHAALLRELGQKLDVA